MENLKLISVRIDPDTIEKIDQFCEGMRCWKRNTVINAMLTELFSRLSDRDLFKMMEYRYRRASDLQISVQIVPKPDEQEDK